MLKKYNSYNKSDAFLSPLNVEKSWGPCSGGPGGLSLLISSLTHHTNGLTTLFLLSVWEN